MRRFQGCLLRALPLLSPLVLPLVFGGCGDNDADDDTHHAPCLTSGAVPDETSGAAETGSHGGSTGPDTPGTTTTGPGASAGDTTTSGGDSTAGTGAVSASDSAGDTGGSSAGDTGGADDSTGGADTTGDSTAGDSTSGDSTSGDSTGETAGDSSGGGDGPSFMGEIWPIFSGACGCHKDSNGAGGLVLKKSNAFDNMVGKASKQLPAMKLVAPGDPEMSYLWHKLNDSQKSVGGKGKKMPPGGLLDKQSLDLVKQWIEQGALP